MMIGYDCEMLIVKLKGIKFDFNFSPGSSCAPRIDGQREQYNKTSYAALNKDKIVGALTIGRSRSGKTIHANGTIVRPAYIKQGIGRELWHAMLKSEKPKRVSVTVISDRGYSLVESMKESFPNIKWIVEENGDRKLRRLKY